MYSLTLWHWLIIGLGGGLGAMARFALVTFVQKSNSSLFPWGTFAVNVLGSFIIGLAFVFFTIKYPMWHGQWRSFAIVGVLGAFTTFSSFALEALLLLQQHYYVMALLYMLASVMVCLIAVAAGFSLGKLIF